MSTYTASGAQWGALRKAFCVITFPDARILLDLLGLACGEDGCAADNADDGLDSDAAGTAERVRMRIDEFASDAVFRIDAHPQNQVRGDDTRECV